MKKLGIETEDIVAPSCSLGSGACDPEFRSSGAMVVPRADRDPGYWRRWKTNNIRANRRQVAVHGSPPFNPSIDVSILLRNACRFKSCLQPINMRAFLSNKLERSKCKWMEKWMD